MRRLSSTETIGCVRRRSERTAAHVRAGMKRGVTSLATIASTAPFVGFYGTVRGIEDSFPSCGCDRATLLAAIAERLSFALAPAAMGLLVAIPALWCYRYLCSEIEGFDIEMQNASLRLVNYLVAPGR
ncbi:MAG: MotA/TolQ/ExbB proton channel family protein [Bryobacteraceae bacterium]